jgi:hypothetical protein
MNLDHCMYVFHASLLINCYQRFKISQEVHSWCGMSQPVGGWVHYKLVSELLVQTPDCYGQKKCESEDSLSHILYICVNLGENGGKFE